MNARRIAITVTLGLLGLALAMLWLAMDRPALADPAGWTVCPDGPPTCDFATIQEGVDAADDGDLVKIATGVYTGVHGRPVPPGYPAPPFVEVITQVVYLTKTLTLEGGYGADFGEPSDPIAHPTTLDAQGQGRVLLIAGQISPTVAGLRVTGGDAFYLFGADSDYYDGGGGVYVLSATVTLSDNQIVSNTISRWGWGAGVYLRESPAILANNVVTGNRSSGWHNTTTGGGLYLYGSDAWLGGNLVAANTTGGLYLSESAATLAGNTISGNASESSSGGGLYLVESHATLRGNLISGNTAGEFGGGLYIYNSDVTLDGNTILSNTAATYGGGLFLGPGHATLNGNTIAHNTALCDPVGDGGGLSLYGSEATLTNNLVADNQANRTGGGLSIWGGSPRLLHTTIARNRGGEGSAIWITNAADDYATVALTNTILVSHSVGISLTASNSATLEATLWGTATWANEADWGGTGTIVTGTHNYRGDPAFVDPDAGDYHIGPGSAALDRGVDAGVTADIDGQPRPYGPGPDIGADELQPTLEVSKGADPASVETGTQLTYTLRVTNTGLLSLTATITDILPSHVTPTGVLTWMPSPILPGGTWSETAVVTVEMGYRGPLTNAVHVATQEGASGAYTVTVTVHGPISHIYLPLVLRHAP